MKSPLLKYAENLDVQLTVIKYSLKTSLHPLHTSSAQISKELPFTRDDHGINQGMTNLFKNID